MTDLTPDAGADLLARIANWREQFAKIASGNHAPRSVDAHGAIALDEVFRDAATELRRLAAEVGRLRGDALPITIESGPEAHCETCGRHNVVWFTPSCYWNPVARTLDAPDPMLCPTCFIRMAESAFPNQAWMVTPEFSDEGPFPDGVRAYYAVQITALAAEVERLRERISEAEHGIIGKLAALLDRVEFLERERSRLIPRDGHGCSPMCSMCRAALGGTDA